MADFLRRLRRIRRIERIPRVIPDRSNPLEVLSVSEVYERYRFRPHSVEQIVVLIYPRLNAPTRRSSPLPPLLSLLVALQFFASGTHQLLIADMHQVSRSSVCRAIHRVTAALCELLKQFVVFPRGERARQIQREFYNIAGFPRVLGCVDGTHIKIQAPHDNEVDFINRKGFHSINVQMVCDAQFRVTNVVAKWPGSVHDSRMFRESDLCQQFEDGDIDGIVLGDSGYPCKPYLMTPYGNPQGPSQERSSYADMLHDTERNQMYYKALEKAVTKLRRQNKPVHVLDIGTGTGLLSMMAARLGADTVHACEAFKPMAECARKIVKKNGYGDKIKLIPKRSTDVTVGQGKDMSHRANILVTEVFDTELIGEGAIGTFTHAHRELLEKDCIVVPAVGNMYVQLVSSDFVHRWNQIDDFVVDGAQRVTSPNSISSCGGAPSLHDLQLDQLPQETFDKLTNPARVFRFDFTGRTTLPFDNTSVIDCVTLNHGRVDAVFMWWDLEMDEEGEIILSCAPRWAHPTPSDMQWRDHWMQAIYYPYSQVSVAKGDTVKVISKHDEYSLWFDVAMETCKDSSPEERPICTCGAHVTYSRSRMGMLSDPDRRNVYTNVLKKHIGSDSICLCISDGSLVPIIAAQLGAKHVYTIETNPMCNRVVREFIKHSNLQEKITILDKNPDQISNSDIDNKIDVVIGEPIFQTSLLPWDNMYFWYSLQHLTNQMTDSAVVLPGTMKIYGIAVKYENLWKIRADVGDCEEFNIQQFDSLIQYTCDKVDEVVEPQPLWEYPCQAAGDVHCLMEMDFTRTLTETLPKETHTMLNVKSNQPCNGVALWAEFNFGESHVITTGPRQPVRIGEKIDWDYYSRQGVHLFYNRNKTGSELGGNKDSSIETQVRFRPENGDLTFKFQPKWS